MNPHDPHHSHPSMDTSRNDSLTPPKLNYKPPPTPASPNAFVRIVRRIYHPLGFKRGYNFFLFFNFAGALVGFCLARLQFLNVDGIFCGPGFSTTNRALPGERYWYRSGHERIGIILHLATVLPAGLLVWLQFIPAIRYKWITFHRINGYFLLLLSLLVAISGLMITRHAFGGSLGIQVGTAVIGFGFIIGLVMAYINIKRLQIDQHRAWMLRAWFWAGAIITSRPISFLGAIIISKSGYVVPMPCKIIEFLMGSPQATRSVFPACAAYVAGENRELWVVVPAQFTKAPSPAHAAAGIQMAYGMGGWLALAMHAVGVEIYLHLTSGETHRLRTVSYQRQLEAGMKHPGNAGLTSDRLGDMGTKPRFQPDQQREKPSSHHIETTPGVLATNAGTHNVSPVGQPDRIYVTG